MDKALKNLLTDDSLIAAPEPRIKIAPQLKISWGAIDFLDISLKNCCFIAEKGVTFPRRFSLKITQYCIISLCPCSPNFPS